MHLHVVICTYSTFKHDNEIFCHVEVPYSMYMNGFLLMKIWNENYDIFMKINIFRPACAGAATRK